MNEVRAMYCEDDFRVRSLGECRIESPLAPMLALRQHSINYVDESDRILVENTASGVKDLGVPLEGLIGLEPAGARRQIYFDPSKTRAGIVTCELSSDRLTTRDCTLLMPLDSIFAEDTCR